MSWSAVPSELRSVAFLLHPIPTLVTPEVPVGASESPGVGAGSDSVLLAQAARSVVQRKHETSNLVSSHMAGGALSPALANPWNRDRKAVGLSPGCSSESPEPSQRL